MEAHGIPGVLTETRLDTQRGQALVHAELPDPCRLLEPPPLRTSDTAKPLRPHEQDRVVRRVFQADPGDDGLHPELPFAIQLVVGQPERRVVRLDLVVFRGNPRVVDGNETEAEREPRDERKLTRRPDRIRRGVPRDEGLQAVSQGRLIPFGWWKIPLIAGSRLALRRAHPERTELAPFAAPATASTSHVNGHFEARSPQPAHASHHASQRGPRN